MNHIKREHVAIAVIDYGAGNIGSVVNALVQLGCRPTVTGAASTLLKADAVILPGVGAAADTMKGLSSAGIDEVVRQLVELKKPLFAVCVGLQVLFDVTEEDGEHQCLGIIPGRVCRLPAGLKIPHMGWNQVKQVYPHPLFTGIPDNTNFYFVHSYYASPQDGSMIAGKTEYGFEFCSMIIRDTLFATQFHPEKSGEYGLKMYANFIEYAL